LRLNLEGSEGNEVKSVVGVVALGEVVDEDEEE